MRRYTLSPNRFLLDDPSVFIFGPDHLFVIVIYSSTPLWMVWFYYRGMFLVKTPKFYTMIPQLANYPKSTNLLLYHSVRERTKLCSRFIDRPTSIRPVSHKMQLQWSSVLIFDLGVPVSKSNVPSTATTTTTSKINKITRLNNMCNIAKNIFYWSHKFNSI